MGITFDKDSGIFHLFSDNTSYVLKLTKQKDIVHLYWGKRVMKPAVAHLLRPVMRAFAPASHLDDIEMSYDSLPLEYPFYGTGDFRSPAFQIMTPDGSLIAEPKYLSHYIIKGKPGLPGLPATYVESTDEAQTLSIILFDPLIKLKVNLVYSVFDNFDAITRHVVFVNEGTENIHLLRALSATVNFNQSDFKMIQLSGSWVRERYLHTRQIEPGITSIESSRGASSHQHNPFFVLAEKDFGEQHGHVYGFSLVYSGNFLAQVEVDQFYSTRASIGINPFNFSWLLDPGTSFTTPEAVLVYCADGLGRMSRTYHNLYRKRLCRGKFRDNKRPIIINNWEATYFDFKQDKLLEIAHQAGKLGIELFLLDDGWFGKRDDDESSLGDWVVNTKKLPKGLAGLGDKIVSMGIQFGIWVEPEMISVDSNLYRAHPDWCLHVPGRRRTESRNQLVLDLCRSDVREKIICMLKSILENAPISYVKWDMNRNMTEIRSASLDPERQAETAHRYMLGLYRILDEITSAFPDVLFESCSGGGGRYDPGMLFYMPQTWTSDNTDAINRLLIQYGTSMAYPASTMLAHISAVPNHQVHRNVPLLTRAHVAMSGNLGFQLDITKLTSQEKQVLKEQIEIYKQIRPIIQQGDLFRLLNPFECNLCAWMFVTPDKTRAVLMYCKILAEGHEPLRFVRLQGLDPAKEYRLLGTEEIYPGDVLLNAGFRLPVFIGDFQSALLRFQAI